MLSLALTSILIALALGAALEADARQARRRLRAQGYF